MRGDQAGKGELNIREKQNKTKQASVLLAYAVGQGLRIELDPYPSEKAASAPAEAGGTERGGKRN